MARGGKRTGSGRKAVGDRVPVLVRVDRELEARIDGLRNGRSMSSTVERLLKSAIDRWSEDEEANSALGFIMGQAANAADWNGRTWQNDPATAQALKLAFPLIIDLLAQTAAEAPAVYEHPMFKSADEHARQIFFWVINRLKERGDEYGPEWPAGHPLRNFPRAAATLNFAEIMKTMNGKPGKEGGA
jgi:hypothetical protein